MAKKVVCFTLPEEIVKEIDKMAEELGLSRAKTIEQIFAKGLGLVMVEVKAIKERLEEERNA